ncbi:MAG TPA: hypothetical protein VGX78_04490 [Pirellulales bacterium]|jgi:hypothetical protein|nr:hypothetical protein [Pirellulales bacterium]
MRCLIIGIVVCGICVADALLGRCAPPAPSGVQETPAKLDVAPAVKDDQIKERLARILEATR